MLNATMGKKIRDASADKCKSVPLGEQFGAQNKNPRRLDFELLLGKSNLREFLGRLLGVFSAFVESLHRALSSGRGCPVSAATRSD